MIHMLNSLNALCKDSTEDEMGRSQGLWSRWHRFDKNNIKYIRKFKVDEVPNPMIEDGYSEWRRGTGPLSPAHYEKVVASIRKNIAGKPKNNKTKYLMRQAKLGVPKSEEHKRNMSLAQQRRFAREKHESNKSEVSHT